MCAAECLQHCNSLARQYFFCASCSLISSVRLGGVPRAHCLLHDAQKNQDSDVLTPKDPNSETFAFNTRGVWAIDNLFMSTIVVRHCGLRYNRNTLFTRSHTLERYFYSGCFHIKCAASICWPGIQHYDRVVRSMSISMILRGLEVEDFLKLPWFCLPGVWCSSIVMIPKRIAHFERQASSRCSESFVYPFQYVR